MYFFKVWIFWLKMYLPTDEKPGPYSNFWVIVDILSIALGLIVALSFFIYITGFESLAYALAVVIAASLITAVAHWGQDLGPFPTTLWHILGRLVWAIQTLMILGMIARMFFMIRSG